MSFVIAEHELYRSCEILFGLEPNINRDFLEYLQASGVKNAYREKARETHPDMVFANGDYNPDLFRTVQEAYENLSAYLKAREKGFRFPALSAAITRRSRKSFRPPNQNVHARRNHSETHPKNGVSGKRFQKKSNRFKRPVNGKNSFNWQTDSLYKGPIPRRVLLFGHFLYYSGIINWRNIIQALVWQRNHRPRVGEIACRFGWLTEEEVLHILKNRTLMRPFGKAALDLGLLTKGQLNIVVLHQKRLQKKIGKYFTEKNILTPAQLDELVDKYHAHNAGLAGPFRNRFNYNVNFIKHS